MVENKDSKEVSNNKRKWYTLWYYWVIILSVILNLFFMIAIKEYFIENQELQTIVDKNQSNDEKNISDDERTSEKKEDPINEESNEPQKINKTKLNEDVPLAISNKEVASIKITEVSTNQNSFPSHMVSLDDYDTTKMISVTIDYKNIAMPEAFLPHSGNFQAFDKDGKSLKRVNQQNGQDSVTEGRTGTTKIFFELPIDGNDFSKVEIEFVPGTEKVATFDLDVTH